jgi:hypothetical protein
MKRIAAKVAQKICVLFQHDDIDAIASQKEAQHHPRRSPADNATLGSHRQPY